MFRASVLLLAVLLSLSSSLSAQVLSSEKIRGDLGDRAELSTRSVKRASLWTATLPVTFSRLERADDEWQLGANMSIGGSFVFVTGKASPQGDGSYRLDPEFMVGPVANFGVTPGDSGTLDATLIAGLSMGFSSIAILGAYDLLLGRPVIGIGMQIQSLTYTESLTRLTRFR